jgi:hypothetical protein
MLERMFDSRGSEPGDDGSPDVACARITSAVDALAGEDPALLSLPEQVARLRMIGWLIDRLEAERVRLVGTAERTGALADDGSATAASWLRRHSTLTAAQAAERAKIARRLSHLPVIADALRAGDIGIAHATQIDRLCRDVGVDQVAGVQAELITAATRLRDIAEFTRMCAGWRHALRPDAADDADDRAYAGRRVSLSSTFDGAFHLSGVLDAEAGATLATAIDAFLTHDPPDTPPELQRSVDQRRADALLAVGQAALASQNAPEVAGARPQLIVRVNLADLLNHPDHPDHHRLPGGGRGSGSPPTVDRGGSIGRGTLSRLFDDCAITRIIVDGDGRPLDVGTTTRVWPAAIRKAITERDRGCRFDGCDRPPAWCDIDHIVPVEAHGPTAVDNGILLCRHHHRAKRRDGWWPTLHPDATVTWTHADGRTRIDPPPHIIDGHIRTLLTAADTAVTGDVGNDGYAAAGDDTAGYTYPTRGARRDNAALVTAGEARPTYDAQRAPPPTPHDTTNPRPHDTHACPHGRPPAPTSEHACQPCEGVTGHTREVTPLRGLRCRSRTLADQRGDRFGRRLCHLDLRDGGAGPREPRVGQTHEQPTPDDVAGYRPGQVARELQPRRRTLEHAQREDGHVGDRVLEAGRDEREQAPPQRDQLGRVALRAVRHPQRDTDQHVAQHRSPEQLRSRGGGLVADDGRDQLVPARPHRSATVHQGREPHRTDQVAEQRHRPHDGEISPCHRPPVQPVHQRHGVAGEQFGAGEHDQGQGDAEHRTLHQRRHRRPGGSERCRHADQQHHGDTDVRTRVRRQQDVPGQAAGLLHFRRGDGGRRIHGLWDRDGHGGSFVKRTGMAAARCPAAGLHAVWGSGVGDGRSAVRYLGLGGERDGCTAQRSRTVPPGGSSGVPQCAPAGVLLE